MAVAGTALSEARSLLGNHPYRARILKSLIEAGIVESGLRNLNYGDRDSQGFLQQRPSQGWGSVAQVRDVRHATRSFVERAKPIAGRYKSAGALAQAVQRSAYPDRYDDVAGRAQSIIRGSGGSGSAGGGALVPGVAGASSSALPEVGSTAAADALIQSLEPPPQAPLGQLVAPQTIAGPVMPGVAGYQVPQLQSSGAVAPPPSVEDVIAEATQLRREAPAEQQAAGTPGLVVPGGSDVTAGGSGGGERGKVTVAKGADRAGVRTSGRVVDFVGEVAGVYGRPLTIGTGTNHNRLTTSGRVSDHWAGNAADVPASGSALTRLGQSALIAAGMDPKKARRERGGLYNLNVGGRRVQIIFNTNTGGNHYNHLHVGVR